jgi:hypothetical protein
MTTPSIDLRVSLFVAALLLAVTVWLAPHRVLADDASEAQLNYEIGQEYYGQRRYVEALEHFLTSYRLVPNASVAFNIGQVYVLLRRPMDGYNWFETVLSLGPAEETRAVATAARDALLGQVAVLEVTSTPDGAALYIDRVDLGTSGNAPRHLAVEPGARTVIARLDRHHDASASATAVRGSVVHVHVDLTPITGTAHITTLPEAARIERADTGEVLGVSPLEIALPIGSVRLRAVLDGYVDQVGEALITEGEPREIVLRLSREASSVATLSVTGTPTGARVSVRGEELGRSPVTRSDLTPGTAELTVEADGLDPYVVSVLLEAGSATRVNVTLRPPPTWDWPVWRVLLYTSSGLLVGAGGVMGGLAWAQRETFYSDPTRANLDAIEPRAIASDVLIGTGAALLAVTIVLDLVSAPPRSSEGEIEVER